MSPPTVKQHLAALRMLFDWLVTGHVIDVNPAHAVRGPKYAVKRARRRSSPLRRPACTSFFRYPRQGITKSDGKLGGRQFPSDRGILPFFGNVAQDQIDQLSGCFIARKMASGFEHLAQLHVHAFDRVGRVNDLSDFVGISEKGDDLFPYSAPALSDGRDLFPKGPCSKSSNRLAATSAVSAL